jgi:hypothetical protein
MSHELSKLLEKVDAFKIVLNKSGFNKLEFFWYSDGVYTSKWSEMTTAIETPDREDRLTMWQFGFRSQNSNNKRIHLEAMIPYAEDYFHFELRYYPEIKLHERNEYAGPTVCLTVSSILEEDLTNIQKYIEYLTQVS